MSSSASAQMPKDPENTVESARDIASDQLKSESTIGSSLSPACSKLADMEMFDNTKPQLTNSKVAQERGLRFWLILVALGSALCLVSIELVRVAKHLMLMHVNKTFIDGNIDSPACYHESSRCGHLDLDIFFV